MSNRRNDVNAPKLVSVEFTREELEFILDRMTISKGESLDALSRCQDKIMKVTSGDVINLPAIRKLVNDAEQDMTSLDVACSIEDKIRKYIVKCPF